MSQKKGKRKNLWKKPTLFFNTKEEDRKVCHLIMASGMPCEFLATGDEKTPYLLHRLIEYRGLKEIKEFVERWKEWKEEQSK